MARTPSRVYPVVEPIDQRPGTCAMSIRSAMRRNLVLLAALFLLTATGLSAEPPLRPGEKPQEQLVAAVLKDFPPLFVTYRDGNQSGFVIEALHEIARDAGFQISLLPVENWSEGLDALRSGKATIIAGIGKTEWKEDEFTFSTPLDALPVNAFCRPGCKYDTLSDELLRGVAVGVMKGSAAEDIIAHKGGVELSSIASLETGIFQLLAGNVDIFVGTAPVIIRKAELAGISRRIQKIEPPLIELRRGILVRKSDAALLEHLNPAIERFLSSPHHSELYRRWYGEKEEQRTARVWFWLLVTAGLLTLFFGALAVRKSKKEQQLQNTLVAERRSAAERKREYERTLAQAQKMEALGLLAGGVAHDFNNLLMVIGGHTEMLKADRDVSEKTKQKIQIVQTALEQAKNMTNSLLLFSRRLPVSREPVDLTLMLDEVLTLISRTLPASIKLDVRRTGSDLVVLADASQLKQVLMNLVINARDAMPDGGSLLIELDPAGEVPSRLQCENLTRFAEIVVRDTGVGSSPEVLPHVFEPFFTTKPRGKGTGLGLAVVHGIVMELGGDIRIDSIQGSGTAVHVLLPFSTERSGDVVRTGGAPNLCMQGKSVILAEDNPEVATVVTAMLSEIGFKVTHVPDGNELIAKVQSAGSSFYLMVVDVDLPGRNGLEALRLLRQEGCRRPALIITGNAAPELSSELGQAAVLRKPFSKTDLCRQLATMLSS